MRSYDSIDESESRRNRYETRYGTDLEPESNIKSKIIISIFIILLVLVIIFLIYFFLFKKKVPNSQNQLILNQQQQQNQQQNTPVITQQQEQKKNEDNNKEIKNEQNSNNLNSTNSGQTTSKSSASKSSSKTSNSKSNTSNSKSTSSKSSTSKSSTTKSSPSKSSNSKSSSTKSSTSKSSTSNPSPSKSSTSKTSTSKSSPSKSSNSKSSASASSHKSSSSNNLKGTKSNSSKLNSTKTNTTKLNSTKSNLSKLNKTLLNLTDQDDFYKIFPKIHNESTLNNITNITNITQLFKSRKLYINNRNISKEYIHYIRPINETEEKNYKKVLYPNLTFYNYSNISKEGKVSIKYFYQLCNQSKLITTYNKTKSKLLEKPLISVIIPNYNKNKFLVPTLNSVVNQTLKNIEIIIIDDDSTLVNKKLYKSIYENDTRIRIFKHRKNMGVWRSRLDGFLYSTGKYILHIDPGDFLTDQYVLEEIYNLAYKYNLDTVRFSFGKILKEKFDKNQSSIIKHNYPKNFLQIIYGRPNYNVHFFGYGTIWNRLIRANVILKGLDLVDDFILNAHKNLWDDMWMNDLVDRVSFSNLIVNRLGYISIVTSNTVGIPKIKTTKDKNKTMKEFILFWLFDYQLLPKEDNKKAIIKKLRSYIKPFNHFFEFKINLSYLKEKFSAYNHLLKTLIKDPNVEDDDKDFVKELLEKAPKNKNKT